MTNLVDHIHFKDLADRDPMEICSRTDCTYNDQDRYFTISIWGDDFAIYPHESKITCIGDHSHSSHEYLDIFIVHYLLHSKKIEPSGNWISEKDIPGGPTFFRGPHEIPTRLIHRHEISTFMETCQQLDGQPLNMADAAYRFDITDHIPVAALYWDGDEDFPPDSKILFDQTMVGLFALDIVFALAVAVRARIGGKE